MAQFASSSNPTMRDYFEKSRLGHILERLVVVVGEERPTDVLAFIESWAAKERKKERDGNASSMMVAAGGASVRRGSAGVSSTTPPTHSMVAAPSSASPVEAAREAWRNTSEAGSTVASHFFSVLFTQHASLKRKVFGEVDLEAATGALGPLLSKAVAGELDRTIIHGLAKQHGLGRSVEAKHFHYFLTAALTATSIALKSSFEGAGVAEGFRQIFTWIGDALQVGLGLKPAGSASGGATGPAASVNYAGGSGGAMSSGGGGGSGDADEGPGVSTQDGLAAVNREWSALAAQAREDACARAVQVLFTQHPMVQKRLFADIDATILAKGIAEVVGGFLSGALSDDAAVALGTRLGRGSAVEPRHFHYFLTAGLTAAAVATPKSFPGLRDAWRVALTNLVDLLQAGALADRAQHAGEEPHTQGPGDAAAGKKGSGGQMSNKEAMAALSDRSAFDVVRESWDMLPDKGQLVMRFYAVLLTQHSSLCKTGPLRDVDLEPLVPTVVTYLTGFVSGTLPLAELTALGAAEGRPRRVTLTHLHYFLSAALTALGITIGETWLAVADQWKEVLSKFVELVARGCEEGEAGEEAAPSGSISIMPHGGGTGASAATAGGDAEEGGDLKEKVFSDEECLRLARESWAALGKDDKRRTVVDTFFSILFTQHPTVRRKLFAGTDPEVMAAPLEAALTAAIAAPNPAAFAAATALATEHGAPRKPETRHYHYFLTAMLASLAVGLGRAAFRPVSEPWRRVLTMVMQSVMAGAPPSDGGDTAGTTPA